MIVLTGIWWGLLHFLPPVLVAIFAKSCGVCVRFLWSHNPNWLLFKTWRVLWQQNSLVRERQASSALISAVTRRRLMGAQTLWDQPTENWPSVLPGEGQESSVTTGACFNFLCCPLNKQFDVTLYSCVSQKVLENGSCFL